MAGVTTTFSPILDKKLPAKKYINNILHSKPLRKVNKPCLSWRKIYTNPSSFLKKKKIFLVAYHLKEGTLPLLV